MANNNQFPGLSRGPIDHKGNSVINVIADGKIEMGTAVELVAPPGAADELLARVQEHAGSLGDRTYGIVVGGDNDGVYGDGSTPTSTDDATRASAAAGQTVVVVTQGRCLAKVKGGASALLVVPGVPLTPLGTAGTLQVAIADSGENVIAVALQSVTSGDTDMIAVDVQREGGDTN